MLVYVIAITLLASITLAIFNLADKTRMARINLYVAHVGYLTEHNLTSCCMSVFTDVEDPDIIKALGGSRLVIKSEAVAKKVQACIGEGVRPSEDHPICVSVEIRIERRKDVIMRVVPIDWEIVSTSPIFWE